LIHILLPLFVTGEAEEIAGDLFVTATILTSLNIATFNQKDRLLGYVMLVACFIFLLSPLGRVKTPSFSWQLLA